MDLAAELGRAEADVGEGGLRKLDKGDDGDALRAEVKSLKEANKALALYTSKILDRILCASAAATFLFPGRLSSLTVLLLHALSRRRLRERVLRAADHAHLAIVADAGLASFVFVPDILNAGPSVRS